MGSADKLEHIRKGEMSWDAAAKEFIAEYPNASMLLARTLAFDSAIHDENEIVDCAFHFWPVIKNHLFMEDAAVALKYELWERKRREQVNSRILLDAIDKAQHLIIENNVADASAIIFAAYHKINRPHRTFAPIENVNQKWEGYLKRLEKWRTRDIIGFDCGLSSLTDCLLGLRRMVMLGAPAGIGKTMLALQMALDVLRNHPDACCLFVSLEMDTDELMGRIPCNRVGFGSRTWMQDNSNDGQATDSLSYLNNRLVIIGREDFGGTEGEIISIINELAHATNCSRKLVIIDYLQVFDVPEEMANILRSDLQMDRWRIEAMRRIRNSIANDDALIVISECKKRKDKGDLLTLEDFIGSVRVGYAGDTALLMQDFTAKEKAQYLSIIGSGISSSYPHPSRSSENLKPAEIADAAKKIDDYLQVINTKFYWLDIAKARDGTIRRPIPITAHYNQLQITEGILGSGLVSPSKQIGRKKEVIDEPFASVE